jgi:hypothetical protein
MTVMSTIAPPLPIKLFVGMLSRDPSLFLSCAETLSRELGALQFTSPVRPWNHTTYYTREMGPDLLRQFLFFETIRDPDILAEVKYRTQQLERKHAEQRDGELRRQVNLDPGYITEAKVVLATAKDFPHRISIGRGVYAESTLHYSRDAHGFVPVEHTYPDFCAEEVRQWFTEARERLRKVLQGR